YRAAAAVVDATPLLVSTVPRDIGFVDSYCAQVVDAAPERKSPITGDLNLGDCKLTADLHKNTATGSIWKIGSISTAAFDRYTL
ncbi:hypothetical protein, partial [Synechococcus sp. W60.3]|uniref:hypothetical protein n=1 Tax=Synechococcus sp. W60.3 TaxID=2967125 RepID=UPI0039C62CFA